MECGAEETGITDWDVRGEGHSSQAAACQPVGVSHTLVVVTQGNIARLSPSHVPAGVMHAVGYIWGQDLGSIRAPLPPEAGGKFDVIILADLLFNRTEHDKLLWTCQQCLAERGTAWVAFSHHDPQKADLVGGKQLSVVVAVRGR